MLPKVPKEWLKIFKKERDSVLINIYADSIEEQGEQKYANCWRGIYSKKHTPTHLLPDNIWYWTHFTRYPNTSATIQSDIFSKINGSSFEATWFKDFQSMFGALNALAMAYMEADVV